jgi:hypothetical protein
MLVALGLCAGPAAAQTGEGMRKQPLHGPAPAPVPAPAPPPAPEPQRARMQFLLVNESTLVMEAVRTRPAGSDTWGNNLLGTLRLPSGNGVKVHHPESRTCVLDVRASYAGGVEATLERQDLCAARLLRFGPPTPR